MSRSYEKSACSRCGVPAKMSSGSFKFAWNGEPFCPRCAKEVGLKSLKKPSFDDRRPTDSNIVDDILDIIRSGMKSVPGARK